MTMEATRALANQEIALVTNEAFGRRNFTSPRTMAPGRVLRGRIQRVLALRELYCQSHLCSRRH